MVRPPTPPGQQPIGRVATWTPTNCESHGRKLQTKVVPPTDRPTRRCHQRNSPLPTARPRLGCGGGRKGKLRGEEAKTSRNGVPQFSRLRRPTTPNAYPTRRRCRRIVEARCCTASQRQLRRPSTSTVRTPANAPPSAETTPTAPSSTPTGTRPLRTVMNAWVGLGSAPRHRHHPPT